MLLTSWTKIITSQPLFQVTFDLRSPRVANFLASSKLQPFLLEQPLKTQTKLKEIEIMH